MSKWFEVEIQTLVVYAVEVPDGCAEQEALRVALEAWTSAGRTTATALPVPSTHLLTIKKNADRVRALGPSEEEDDDD